ncbi:MAG: hypothetical protein WAM30_20515, partial [Candidatus Dormiibacterota bacterium]
VAPVIRTLASATAALVAPVTQTLTSATAALVAPITLTLTSATTAVVAPVTLTLASVAEVVTPRTGAVVPIDVVPSQGSNPGTGSVAGGRPIPPARPGSTSAGSGAQAVGSAVGGRTVVVSTPATTPAPAPAAGAGSSRAASADLALAGSESIGARLQRNETNQLRTSVDGLTDGLAVSRGVLSAPGLPPFLPSHPVPPCSGPGAALAGGGSGGGTLLLNVTVVPSTALFDSDAFRLTPEPPSALRAAHLVLLVERPG